MIDAMLHRVTWCSCERTSGIYIIIW